MPKALRNAIGLDASLLARVSEVPQIVAFRNRLAHQYWGVLATAVWAIVQEDVPRLEDEVRAIRETLSQ